MRRGPSTAADRYSQSDRVAYGAAARLLQYHWPSKAARILKFKDPPFYRALRLAESYYRDGDDVNALACRVINERTPQEWEALTREKWPPGGEGEGHAPPQGAFPLPEDGPAPPLEEQGRNTRP